MKLSITIRSGRSVPRTRAGPHAVSCSLDRGRGLSAVPAGTIWRARSSMCPGRCRHRCRCVGSTGTAAPRPVSLLAAERGAVAVDAIGLQVRHGGLGHVMRASIRSIICSLASVLELLQATHGDGAGQLLDRVLGRADHVRGGDGQQVVARVPATVAVLRERQFLVDHVAAAERLAVAPLVQLLVAGRCCWSRCPRSCGYATGSSWRRCPRHWGKPYSLQDELSLRLHATLSIRAFDGRSSEDSMACSVLGPRGGSTPPRPSNARRWPPRWIPVSMTVRPQSDCQPVPRL